MTTFAASPSCITSGQGSGLRCSATGAASVTIEGIGTLAGNGIAVRATTDADHH
jgi:hypothetical protein